MLHAAGDDAEGAIDDADVRINSHRGGEVRFALAKVAVKEKSVVEVAVAGEDLLHRLRRLVNRIVVALRDHGCLLARVDQSKRICRGRRPPGGCRRRKGRTSPTTRWLHRSASRKRVS